MSVRLNPTPVRPCLACGRDFSPRNPRELRCQGCLHPGREYPKKVCPVCHGVFDHIPGRVYCSPECSYKGYYQHNLRYNREKKRRQAQLLDQKRICPICHSEFPLQGKRLYCSSECQDTARRDRMTAANKRRSEKNRELTQRLNEMKGRGAGATVQLSASVPQPKINVESIRALNQVKTESDKDKLQQRNITSPNEKKMPYHVHNKRLHVTFYFKTKEKYLAFIKKHADEL